MAKISSEKAVQQIGNRFDLILVAARRVRELRRGYAPRIKTQSGAVVTALEEIEQGEVGRDYLLKPTYIK